MAGPAFQWVPSSLDQTREGHRFLLELGAGSLLRGELGLRREAGSPVLRRGVLTERGGGGAGV